MKETLKFEDFFTNNDNLEFEYDPDEELIHFMRGGEVYFSFTPEALDRALRRMREMGWLQGNVVGDNIRAQGKRILHG